VCCVATGFAMNRGRLWALRPWKRHGRTVKLGTIVLLTTATAQDEEGNCDNDDSSQESTDDTTGDGGSTGRLGRLLTGAMAIRCTGR